MMWKVVNCIKNRYLIWCLCVLSSSTQISHYRIKVSTGKVVPLNAMTAYVGWRYCLSASLSQQQMEMSVPLQVLATLSWGKDSLFPQNMQLSGPQCYSAHFGEEKETSYPCHICSQCSSGVQPVA